MRTHIARFTNKKTNKSFIDVMRADEICILSKSYTLVILATFDNFNDAVKNIKLYK